MINPITTFSQQQQQQPKIAKKLTNQKRFDSNTLLLLFFVFVIAVAVLAIVFNARLDLSHICLGVCVCVRVKRTSHAQRAQRVNSPTQQQPCSIIKRSMQATHKQTERDRRTDGQRDKREAGGQTVGLTSATVHAPLHREQKLTGCGSKHVTRQLRQLAALNKFAVKIKRKLQTRNTNRTIDKLRQTAASWRHAFDIELDFYLFLCAAAVVVVASFYRPAGRNLHVRSRQMSRCVGGRGKV